MAFGGGQLCIFRFGFYFLIDSCKALLIIYHVKRHYIKWKLLLLLLLWFIMRDWLNRVGGWVVGYGSWVVGYGSWVVGCRSWVVSCRSWVVSRGSCLFEGK